MHKDDLTSAVIDIVQEFYEKTGVAISAINIDWVQTDYAGKPNKQYAVMKITTETKP